MELLYDYLLRLLPGLVLAGAFFFLVPRRLMLLRLTGYILFFIFIRDAMTPTGLWSFGTEGFFWIRFTGNHFFLILFGLSGIAMVALMNFCDPDLKGLIVWFRGHIGAGIVTGFLGAAVVVLPLAFLYSGVSLSLRGGEVESSLLLPLLVITMGGNLYEEVLFRGYLQGYLESGGETSLRAALTSGVAFAFGHVFLALTVTSVGWPLLLFALYEGIVAGFVRMRGGVIPSTVTHGMAIFFLSSGLF